MQAAAPLHFSTKERIDVFRPDVLMMLLIKVVADCQLRVKQSGRRAQLARFERTAEAEQLSVKAEVEKT
jgi:hypothetical protein